MKFRYILKTATTGLKTHKSRSFLTILGIVIGITSIILMMSIGQGAENLILGEIGGLGAETIIVRPGQEPSGPQDVADLLFTDSIKDREVDLLSRRSNAPDIVAVEPALIVPGGVSYSGETFKPTIMGASAEFMTDAFDIPVREGRNFDKAEINQRSSVAVIGSKVKKELFGDSDAVGEHITIKDRKFQVVGVYEKRGPILFFDFDEIVVIPHTTAQTYLLGIDYYHELIVKATGPEAVARTVRDIELTLREAHNIDNPDKDDFYIVTQQGAVDQVQSIIGALTIFLSSVVAIALVVGGVGVMNIMLVAVTERTREIGLRKALGATDKDIMSQFLVEAVILTGVGGIIGVALGALFAFLVSLILIYYANLDWTFTFPVLAAFLGVAVSTMVGLVFGIYPAKQAAKKDPIDALRYE